MKTRSGALQRTSSQCGIDFHLVLWGNNSAMMAATGEDNADNASAVIVKAFWEKLRGELPKVH